MRGCDGIEPGRLRRRRRRRWERHSPRTDSTRAGSATTPSSSPAASAATATSDGDIGFRHRQNIAPPTMPSRPTRLPLQCRRPGKGIKIGVRRHRINPTLRVCGQNRSASGDVAGDRTRVSDDDGHGTAVSAVAAAARNGSNTMGVAFDATIVSLRADNPGRAADDRRSSLRQRSRRRNRRRAPRGERSSTLDSARSTPVAMLAAMQRAVHAGIVLRDFGPATTAWPIPIRSPSARRTNFRAWSFHRGGRSGRRRQWNVNIDQVSSSRTWPEAVRNIISPRSLSDRRPGPTACSIVVRDQLAARPFGAVALLAQAFPNLTGQAIVDLLLRSADDRGFRHRCDLRPRPLNLGAILAVGTTSLAGTEQVVSTSDNGDLPEGRGRCGNGQRSARSSSTGSTAHMRSTRQDLAPGECEHPLRAALLNDVR